MAVRRTLKSRAQLMSNNSKQPDIREALAKSEEANKRLARAFGESVCKDVQECLASRFLAQQEEGGHHQAAMKNLSASDQLEHLEEMEAASRAVFQRKTKELNAALMTEEEASFKCKSVIKHLLNGAMEAQVKTIDAFSRKRKKLASETTGTRDNPIYLSNFD